MYLVTAAQMRAMDRMTIEDFGLPGRVLMENAGRGAVDRLCRHFGDLTGRRIGVAAGRGNNGGDGFVMARCLKQMGLDVAVFLMADRAKVAGDALANLVLLEPLDVPVFCFTDERGLAARKTEIQAIDIWIDALLGTGLNAEVRGHTAAMIQRINASAKPVLAVDIASGIDADTGRVLGVAVRADVTATFGFAKIGHVTHPGAAFTGKLHAIDIGIPDHIAAAVAPNQFLTTAEDAKGRLPLRLAHAHKGTTGHLLVVAGSPGKTGAAAMTATAALRAGAGLVTLAVPAGVHAVMETQVLEAMTAALAQTGDGVVATDALPALMQLLAAKRCLAVGPGLGTDPETGALVKDLLARCPLPAVIDADGLNLLAGDWDVLARRPGPSVLTPHPGEMARLLGLSTADIQNDRLAAARRLASAAKACVVLKGAGTVIAEPGGAAWINPTGNSGMASGGMGDVLTGIIAGLITQGARPLDAAIAGAYLHGAAGDRLAGTLGPCGYLASELMAVLPETIAGLSARRQRP